MLQCSKCKEMKDESEFAKRSDRKRWYEYWCKKCRNFNRSHQEYRVNTSKSIYPHTKEFSRFCTIYHGIKARTWNPNHDHYKYYWWKGIICERECFKEFYNDMYESFIEHANEHWLWKKYTQIDRTDNNWNYCKENCKWVTAKENNYHNHK